MIRYQIIPKNISKTLKNSPKEHVNELEVKCRLGSQKQQTNRRLTVTLLEIQLKCPFVIACKEVGVFFLFVQSVCDSL